MIVTIGDKARDTFNSIQGKLSNKTSKGYPANEIKITLYHCEHAFKEFMSFLLPQLDIPVCKLTIEYKEHDNMPIVNFKVAGRRLKKEVQGINTEIKKMNFSYDKEQNIIIDGEIALYPNEYFFKKLKDFDLQVDNSKTENTESLNKIIEFRREIKKFITEELKLELTPPVFKAKELYAPANIMHPTIVLRNCKTKFAYDLIEWYGKAFSNTLFKIKIGDYTELSKEKIHNIADSLYKKLPSFKEKPQYKVGDFEFDFEYIKPPVFTPYIYD